MRSGRIAAGLSQAELARKAGLATSYVALLEQGERGSSPKRQTVVRLAEALGLDPTPLLARAGHAPGEATAKRNAVIDALRRDPLLTPAERDALELVYRRLAGLKASKRS
jgi:transcriptional regulator with XRE-family HTH domain